MISDSDEAASPADQGVLYRAYAAVQNQELSLVYQSPESHGLVLNAPATHSPLRETVRERTSNPGHVYSCPATRPTQIYVESVTPGRAERENPWVVRKTTRCAIRLRGPLLTSSPHPFSSNDSCRNGIKNCTLRRFWTQAGGSTGVSRRRVKGTEHFETQT